MKYLLLSILLLLATLTSTGVKTANTQTEYVYICTGYYSQCYHKTDNCEGLQNCSREIKKVTLQQAKEMKRKPCNYCYGKH